MVPYSENGEVPTPSKKNHSTTLFKNKLYVFGGYDGKKNHNQITTFDIKQKRWSILTVPHAPSGRNGHTATLIGILHSLTFRRLQTLHHRWVAWKRTIRC